jgi:hypothetical protein
MTMSVEATEAALMAYLAGWTDGFSGRRDCVRAGDAGTGQDYRIGFLDARMEVYRLLAGLRRIIEGAGE